MAPRTACTAVGEILRQELGGEYLPVEDVIGADGTYRLQRKHNSISELIKYGVLSNGEAARLFKFTCVRNPFDSLVSFYLKKRSTYQPLLQDRTSWVHRVSGYKEDMAFCRDHSFEEWIIRKYGRRELRRWWRRRRRSLSGKYAEGVDFVMRHERLQDDFDEALKRAGIHKSVTIPRINETTEKQRHYREYYTSTARRIVETVFEAELLTYGYRF